MARTSGSSGRSSSGKSYSSSSYSGSNSSSSYSGSSSPKSTSASTSTSTISPAPNPTPTPTSKPNPSPTSKPTPTPTSKPSPSTLSNKIESRSPLMDGLSFGFGAAFGQRIFGGLFGSNSQEHSHTTIVLKEREDMGGVGTNSSFSNLDISKPEYISRPECKSFQEEYFKCIKSVNTDSKSNCDFSLNIFTDCENN